MWPDIVINLRERYKLFVSLPWRRHRHENK